MLAMQTDTSDNAFTLNKLPSQGYSNTMHDVAAVDPYAIAAQQRIMPREIKAGSQRGEMTIQGKLTIANPDSNERIVFGSYNGEFGLFGATSENGDENALSIAWKIIGQTRYIYDLDNGGINIMQDGKLPDGTFGWVVAVEGNNVEDGF